MYHLYKGENKKATKCKDGRTYYMCYRNGVLLEEIYVDSNGEYHGLWRSYSGGGFKCHDMYFYHGKKVGIWRSWNDRGMLMRYTAYSNGLKNGEEVDFDYSTGIVNSIHRYKNGKLDGFQEFYNTHDEKKGVYKLTEFKDGMKIRTCKRDYEYTSLGELAKKYE